MVVPDRGGVHFCMRVGTDAGGAGGGDVVRGYNRFTHALPPARVSFAKPHPIPVGDSTVSQGQIVLLLGPKHLEPPRDARSGWKKSSNNKENPL